ncbi:MAG TPA: tRNA (adenosine(37)-N6)-dimethylallyltransferase MiaA [Chitinophagaceae bacterium]|nr:tRNA (adenosine(37)-N6)-dimethylallyltransferase MiaA [Chitinophagaceae bacterium]
MSARTDKTAIIIVGPTASGKTALSLAFAARYSTSIISADSRQCYRELNIGVAKPSPEELSQCRHYFIDSHSIHEQVDTMIFEKEALAAANEIFKDREMAIVTGGTGLYVKVFCEGIDEIPAVDPGVKTRVEEAWRNGGNNALQQWLTEIDPDFMSSTKEKDNRVRLMRALEVKLSSGRSILEYQGGQKKQRDFTIRKIGIEWPRDILYERINKRVEVMMESGLLEEARSLYPHRHLKALQTVGYQEIFNHLDGKCSLDEAVDKIKQHTRNYAKRQLTWFRKDEGIEWMSWEKAILKT